MPPRFQQQTMKLRPRAHRIRRRYRFRPEQPPEQERRQKLLFSNLSLLFPKRGFMIQANSLPLILKAVKRNCRYRGLRSVYHIPDLSWQLQWGYNKKIVEQTYRFLLCRESTSACCISDNGFCFAAFGSRGTPDFALRSPGEEGSRQGWKEGRDDQKKSDLENIWYRI